MDRAGWAASTDSVEAAAQAGGPAAVQPPSPGPRSVSAYRGAPPRSLPHDGLAVRPRLPGQGRSTARRVSRDPQSRRPSDPAEVARAGRLPRGVGPGGCHSAVEYDRVGPMASVWRGRAGCEMHLHSTRPVRVFSPGWPATHRPPRLLPLHQGNGKKADPCPTRIPASSRTTSASTAVCAGPAERKRPVKPSCRSPSAEDGGRRADPPGGTGRGRPRRPEAGTLERAGCVGYLVGVALKAIEAGDLAARLEAVESVLKARRAS